MDSPSQLATGKIFLASKDWLWSILGWLLRDSLTEFKMNRSLSPIVHANYSLPMLSNAHIDRGYFGIKQIKFDLLSPSA